MEEISDFGHEGMAFRFGFDGLALVERTVNDLVLLFLVENTRDHALSHHAATFELLIRYKSIEILIIL